MTNYERIKNMSVEEMASAIAKGVSSDPCDYCKASEYEYGCNGNKCYGLEDNEVVQKWLESEVEE